MNELQSKRTAEVVAAEIRALTASMLSNVIEIGRRMCEAKELVPHGEFGKWIEENTGYSHATANNFMRLFQEYGEQQISLFGAEAKSQTFGNLSYSKALALLALPAGEREEFAEQHDVEAMSTRELQQAIKERDEALKRAESAEASAEENARTAASLQGELNDARSRIETAEQAESDAKRLLEEAEKALEEAEDARDELTARNKELENRPIDVAVQEDTEAVERARAEGMEAGRAEGLKQGRAEGKKDGAASKQADVDKSNKALEDAKARLEKASSEREAAQRLAESLRQQLDAAEKKNAVVGNADLVEFNVHFKAAQGSIEQMGEVLRRVAESGQTELAEKLRAATGALAQMLQDVCAE